MKYNLKFNWDVHVDFIAITYLSYYYDKDPNHHLRNERYEADLVSSLVKVYQIINDNVDKTSKEYQKFFKPFFEDKRNDFTLANMVLMQTLEDHPGIYKIFNQIWDQDFANADDLVEYLNEEDALSYELKFNILNALQHSDVLYEQLMDFIKDVLKHSKEIEKLLQPLIDHMMEQLTEDYVSLMFEHLNLEFEEFDTLWIEPSFVALDAVQLIAEDSIVKASWGAFAFKDFSYNSTMKEREEYFLEVAKQLSEPTKLEIIKFCLDEERYAKEIATHLDLSGATVSHHMNMLMSFNYVTVRLEKRRIYYKTNKEKILDHFSFINKLFESK